MTTPRIAILSFPGTNCETESVRAIRRAGMEPVPMKWNDSRKKLEEMDGYFLPGGFSYEDRGRSGMVAARDPVLELLGREAEKGKVVIGNCNGAQILVESGLIPLGRGLRMSLAHNALKNGSEWKSPGFLNEWIWIKPSCGPDRCAVSDWSGAMPMPMAHGEGRFVTNDPDTLAYLEENDQIAFQYCDELGNVSDDPAVTPNGSALSIAGLCNPAGNVIALMPHPERTPHGDPYFRSMFEWITKKKSRTSSKTAPVSSSEWSIGMRKPRENEILIGTLITNNEERTVEQALHRNIPMLKLKQYRYLYPGNGDIKTALGSISVFNPNKEVAFVRQKEKLHVWDAAKKTLGEARSDALSGVTFLRKNVPDTGEASFGKGSETGVCYDCRNANEKDLSSRDVLEIFCNPHAGTLERIAA